MIIHYSFYSHKFHSFGAFVFYLFFGYFGSFIFTLYPCVVLINLLELAFCGQKFHVCNWTDYLSIMCACMCVRFVRFVYLFIHSVNEGFTCGIFAVSVVGSCVGRSYFGFFLFFFFFVYTCVRACIYGPCRTPKFS